MIPRRRRFSDLPEGPSIMSHGTENRKRQKSDRNAHFDQMIQSMCRGRRQRKEPSDAYSPSKSTTFASELSFIKKTDTPSLLRSSSVSKVSSESSSHHTCNPLPQWLVNTFMTLSKKNPLRLLLPPDTSEGSSVLHTQTEAIVQPIDVQKSEYLIAPSQTSLITDDSQENWPEPLPFSTPGSGSFLGSSVVSNTALSLLISKEHLFPASYVNETHIGSDLPSNRSHTPIYSSDSLPSDLSISYDLCSETFATDEVGSSWNPSMPEEDCQSLFSSIYTTPGPRYYAPRPVHFESLEDPIISDPLQPGYEIDYDAIDFQWKPFDRKNLVVPDRSQKTIYASGPAHLNGASDTSEYDPTYVVKPVDTETNTLNPHTSPEPGSPLLSVSPTPFRFFLPSESDASTPVPEYQVQYTVPKPSTPKKSPYFAVPGIYISPLDEHRKVYDTIALKKHDFELHTAGHRDDDARNGIEQAVSQASNDSIESWEENLF